MNWKKLLKKAFVWTTIAFSLFILAFTFFYYAVKLGAFGDLPTEDDLLNIQNYEASEVYSSDSVLIGKFFVENRSNVQIENVAPHIIQQLISTEDERFYEHNGFDKTGAVRVLIKSVILQQNAGGGSTISQQLAKNLFGRGRHGILSMPVNKTKEVIIAQQLEDFYTKDEILQLYLNTVSFGEDTYGIKSACSRFFNTTPKNISVENSAVLIGMLKAPTTYNPRLHPGKAKERRNIVLHQCVKNGYLSEERYDEIKNRPIQLKYNNVVGANSLAPYFQQQIKKHLSKSILNKDNNILDLKTSGLKIYTSINAQLQKNAEQAVLNHLQHLQPQFETNIKSNRKIQQYFDRVIKSSSAFRKLKALGKNNKEILSILNQKKNRTIAYHHELKDTLISFIDSLIISQSTLHSAFYAVNPNNGMILAWVGDANYQTGQYDHVKTKRQVGSIFKPLVYATALENGFEPCSFIDNKKITYSYYDNWAPSNSDGNYEGRYSLVGGLTYSVNTISVKLCMDLGIKKVLNKVKQFGITDSLPQVPSVALGVGNISLFEMVNAYTTFPNQGKRIEPRFITHIINKNGDTIYKSEIQEYEVISPEHANQMNEMLNSVVENGTAKKLKYNYGIADQLHGKTGTTQNHSDGWFMGYNQNIVAGVWVGASSPFVSFNNIQQGQGANLALPIWAMFYKKSLQNRSSSTLVSKDITYPRTINCRLYKDDNLLQKFFQKDEATVHKQGLKTNALKSRIKKFLKKH